MPHETVERPTKPAGAIGEWLPHIDFMRVCVFTLVVSAHVVTSSLNVAQFGVAAWGMLMHFTRYAFVFISAFVLFHGYRDRTVRPLTFWRRRFSSVVLPYLLWTAIYLTLSTIDTGWPGTGTLLTRYGLDTVSGSGWYHLYFLLVSMQFYLVFPAAHRLVRRCRGHHGLLLAAAAALQIAYMTLVSTVPAPTGAPGTLWTRSEVMLPMYTLFLTGGALTAVHLDRVQRWVSTHLATIAAATVLGLVITGSVFLLRATPLPWNAAAPSYPALLPWVITAITCVYALGTAWARGTPPDTRSIPIVRAVAQRAFGVFAMHPLVLWLLERTLLPTLAAWIPHDTARATILFLLTISATLALVELAHRSPVSKALIARPRHPRRARG